MVNSCLRVFRAETLAIHRHHRDSKMLRIGLGEFGNVVGYFPFFNIFVLLVNVFENFLDVRKRGH